MLRHSTFQSLIFAVTSFALLSLGLAQSASAGMISTQQVVDQQQRSELLNRIESRLQQEAVAGQLAAFGVDQGHLQARISQMTTAELQSLDGKIEQQIAGADAVALVGAVFIVLLVLEIVGVIDIFKKV